MKMITPRAQRSDWEISETPSSECYDSSKLTNQQNSIFNDALTGEIDQRYLHGQQNRK